MLIRCLKQFNNLSLIFQKIKVSFKKNFFEVIYYDTFSLFLKVDVLMRLSTMEQIIGDTNTFIHFSIIH